MEITLAEAATAVNLTKQGLLKAIRDGRLSGQKDTNGIWKVDTAELFRVYKPATGKAETAANEYEPGHPQVAELVARLEAAADIRRLLEDRLARAERDLDAANARVDTILRALPAGFTPVQAPPEPPAAPIPMSATPITAVSAEIRPVERVSAESQGEGHEADDKPKKRGFLSRLFGWGGE